MKQFYTILFFIAFFLAVIFPATLSAQDSFTITSSGDKGAWDDPDTEDYDEARDGICDDGTGNCPLRAALEEAANRGYSFIVNL